ncbi:MAG: hypothetical protein AAF387_04175 [Pseudomonadota bacterium]
MTVPIAHYWALLSTRLQAQRFRVLTLAILLLSSIGVQLIIPQVMRLFIDGIQAGASMQALFQIALIFLGVAILKYGFIFGANYASQIVGWMATSAPALSAHLRWRYDRQSIRADDPLRGRLASYWR